MRWCLASVVFVLGYKSLKVVESLSRVVEKKWAITKGVMYAAGKNTAETLKKPPKMEAIFPPKSGLMLFPCCVKVLKVCVCAYIAQGPGAWGIWRGIRRVGSWDSWRAQSHASSRQGEWDKYTVLYRPIRHLSD